MKRAILSLALALCACAPGVAEAPTPISPPPGETPAEDTCGASRFQHLIGTPATAIDRASLPPRARVIMPGQMITMDYSAQRLNLRVAPDGKVTEIACF